VRKIKRHGPRITMKILYINLSKCETGFNLSNKRKTVDEPNEGSERHVYTRFLTLTHKLQCERKESARKRKGEE